MSKNKSLELFTEGYNCAQSVFVPLVKSDFPNESLAFQIMSPFGGGIANTDSICGAVTGGLSAIGFHIGHNKSDDVSAKVKCSEATRKFIDIFKKEFGTINCTSLINYNLSNPTEKEQAMKSGITKTKCPKIVELAATLAKEIIAENT